MIVFVGILAYFGIAILVGRFLSLSTRGEIFYPVTEPAATLYSPQETVNLSAAERPVERERTGQRREEEHVHS